ncbi:hypothetical protein MNBD_GAMMA17-261 [hydrothermal vent metagenome]|uniref:Uncharacterized protein n=1 Tax=hydrothermal vent metagenome TaxID=652676 RepID=A0A3B0ZJA8_9ZZZZ
MKDEQKKKSDVNTKIIAGKKVKVATQSEVITSSEKVSKQYNEALENLKDR